MSDSDSNKVRLTTLLFAYWKCCSLYYKSILDLVHFRLHYLEEFMLSFASIYNGIASTDSRWEAVYAYVDTIYAYICSIDGSGVVETLEVEADKVVIVDMIVLAAGGEEGRRLIEMFRELWVALDALEFAKGKMVEYKGKVHDMGVAFNRDFTEFLYGDF